jgi:hypothetical protein
MGVTFADGGENSSGGCHGLVALPHGELQGPLALDGLLHGLPDEPV